jgi:hypothetical protein
MGQENKDNITVFRVMLRFWTELSSTFFEKKNGTLMQSIVTFGHKVAVPVVRALVVLTG